VVGAIVLSADFLFEGYFNIPYATAARLSAGRYHTRDLGFVRNGELFVLGRKDDLLIINGRNLHAHEVEAVVTRIPGVKPGRAAVMGVFNEQTGSQELVVVAEREIQVGPPPLSDRDLARTVRQTVYEHTSVEVKTCRIVDPGWLVKTTSGKISREANQAKYLTELAQDASTLNVANPNGTTFGRLADVIAEQFKCPADRITRETVAEDFDGWDSLGHATLMVMIEERFGIRFDENEMFRFSHVGELCDRIEALRQEHDSRRQDESRFVHDTKLSSVIRIGRPSDIHVIVFAGSALKFAGLDLMDFASTLGRTGAQVMTKFFVTDRDRSWYYRCFDELVDKLNAISGKPKILIGNSMGGYGALRFATALNNVVATLAFVPQRGPVADRVIQLDQSRAFWPVRFAPNVRYCILYGEAEDLADKEHMKNQVFDAGLQRLVMVPNCGHDLVEYLNREELLASVLDCCLCPNTMAEQISEIASSIRTSSRPLLSVAMGREEKNHPSPMGAVD
jgi:acyl carrier protein